MGYNKSLGIHGIFKKERFTEEAYKALSYLKPGVKDALIVDVENNTKDTKGGLDKRADGEEKTIELEYKGPAFLQPTMSPGEVPKFRPVPFKQTYDVKFLKPVGASDLGPSSNPLPNPRILFKEEDGHDTYKNGDFIFVDQTNIDNKDDLINNIANEYADKMANVWGMAITLDDNDDIAIKEMNVEEKKEHEQRLLDEKNEAEQRLLDEKNEAERIEAELEELWASRAELIENVQKNTRIVTIVRPWTTQAHVTDPIRKDYRDGYVELKYKGNISRYAITFDSCEPRNTTWCSSFESEIVAKAGTHIYIISKDLFEKLGINDLIFEKGERADNIESLREVLYTLSQRPIPIPKQSQEETNRVWIIVGVVVGLVFVIAVCAGLWYTNNQSKKTTLVTESLDLVNVNESIPQ